MSPRIVILGSGFAGLTIAAALRDRLGSEPSIQVVSDSEEFLFQPSLIWVPFGLRTREDITFPVRQALAQNEVEFVHASLQSITPERRTVHTSAGPIEYDFLVIATGAKRDYAAVPGLGPGGHAQSIHSWSEAQHAQVAFERFLLSPGHVVIGAAPRAGFIQPAYEFALNMAHQLRSRGPKAWAQLTFITPEPYLGHLGLRSVGSSIEAIKKMFDEYQIDTITDAAIQAVEPGQVVLEGGRKVHFSYAMIAPPLSGIDALRQTPGLVDENGFVRVESTYQVVGQPKIYAAGACVSIPPVEETRVPIGFPTSGYLTEEMGRMVAHNIAATVLGEPTQSMTADNMASKWIMDAGKTGIIMTVDHQAGHREHARLFPGPHAHWAKVAFEKYFLATRRMGLLA